jgi:hypothetical protein
MAIELVGNNLDVVNPFETILPGIPKSQSRRANRRWLGPQPVLEYGASIAFVVAGMTLKWSDSSTCSTAGASCGAGCRTATAATDLGIATKADARDADKA